MPLGSRWTVDGNMVGSYPSPTGLCKILGPPGMLSLEVVTLERRGEGRVEGLGWVLGSQIDDV